MEWGEWRPHLVTASKVLAAMATVAGLITAGIQIHDRVSPPSSVVRSNSSNGSTAVVPEGPPRFAGDLGTVDGARKFRALLDKQDGHVIYVNARCVYWVQKQPACGWLTELEDLRRSWEEEKDGDALTLLELTGSDSCFAVTVQGPLGSLPPEVTNVELRSVSPADVSGA
jgi:hypothetical protein